MQDRSTSHQQFTGSWPKAVLGAFVLFTLLMAAGAGVTVYARPTAVLCACLAVASLTWYSPLHATRVALAVMIVTPFVVVVPQLQPDTVNYSLLYAVIVLPAAIVVCARSPRLVFDSGAVFLTIILGSALVTLLVDDALYSNYGYLLWPVTTLAVYLIIQNARRNVHRWVSGLILVFASVEAVIGISQSVLGWPVFPLALPALFQTDRGVLGYLLPGVSRAVANGSGTFEHFNGLGSLLALALPLSFGQLLRRPASLWRVLLFAVLAMGLLMTYSRGAWLGGTLGCMLVFWTCRPRASRSWVPLLLAGIVMTAALIAPSIVSYYDATQNVSSRLVTWRFALSFWSQHSDWVIFGSGFGSFQQRFLAQESVLRAQMLTALHSGFLQILLEVGIVGLAVFAWVLISTVRPHLSRRGMRWQSVALAAVLAFLVSQAVDNALFAMTGTCAFALVACLRRADARISPADRADDGSLAVRATAGHRKVTHD